MTKSQSFLMVKFMKVAADKDYQDEIMKAYDKRMETS